MTRQPASAGAQQMDEAAMRGLLALVMSKEHGATAEELAQELGGLQPTVVTWAIGRLRGAGHAIDVTTVGRRRLWHRAEIRSRILAMRSDTRASATKASAWAACGSSHEDRADLLAATIDESEAGLTMADLVEIFGISETVVGLELRRARQAYELLLVRGSLRTTWCTPRNHREAIRRDREHKAALQLAKTGRKSSMTAEEVLVARQRVAADRLERQLERDRRRAQRELERSLRNRDIQKPSQRTVSAASAQPLGPLGPASVFDLAQFS